MTQLPLISEMLFKQHSPVTYNTDISDFVPYICIAQELHIQPLLGQAMMDELKEQIATDTLTTENSDLVIRIAPTLSFFTVYQALPFHWASIVNKGVTIRESENSKSVDVNDIAQLRQWIKGDADTLKSQLADFLESRSNDYPMWRPIYACGNVSNANMKYDSGFHFPKR